MKDTENIRNYCKTELEPNSILPRANYIIEGFVVYSYSEHSHIHCNLPSETKEDFDCKPTNGYNQTKHTLYCYM